MVSTKYQNMLTAKSVIREMAEFAAMRGNEIGYENVFDFSLGNPSVPVPPRFSEAIIELLGTKTSRELHGYSPSLGIQAVKEKITSHLNHRYKMTYTANHIFMTAGAAGAIAHALRLVTNPGDKVLTFAPYFPEYAPYVNLSGAKLEIVPPDMVDFQIDFACFEEMLTAEVTAVLINTPHNPTGAIYNEATLTQMAELMTAKQKEYGHDIFLISDEPYRDVVFSGQNQPYISSYYANTLSCFSYSKSHSIPGERIGYLAVNPAATAADLLVPMSGQISRGIGHNCPASLIQLAIAETLDVTVDMSVYETNMNILYNELLALGFNCRKPEGTFYIFPQALEADAAVFCRKALAYDLILVPSDSFGCPGHFRIAYCIQTEKVERSLSAFRRFVEEEYDKKSH
ncbi:MAG: pyridoxal phosphate-dependent aminotransferase [Lachnospiraceae bacterium]|jgi:aspartate aminotransferase|nr:pyridoxal phosphate-dependent aminotransferase [Lachnospiraceae bacterium]